VYIITTDNTSDAKTQIWKNYRETLFDLTVALQVSVDSVCKEMGFMPLDMQNETSTHTGTCWLAVKHWVTMFLNKL